MFTNIYKIKEGLTTTSISGGRQHFVAREPLKAVETYPYEITFGDNFYTLSARIFQDDRYWWALDDLNKPKDAFDYALGDTLLLPKNIVAENRNKKRIF